MSNRHRKHDSSHDSRKKDDSRHRDDRRKSSKPRSSSHTDSRDKRKHEDEKARKDDRRKRQRTRSKSPVIRIKREVLSDDEQTRRNNNRNRPRGKRYSPNDRRSRRHRFNDKKEGEDFQWGKAEDNVKKEESDKPGEPKAKPDFGLSGKLAEDTNTFNGIVIKYNEPQEARKPKRRWRLYPFKGETSLPFIPIHRQSAYLLGRERACCDIPTDHPSCSKQHAVLQFRLVDYERDDGTMGKRIRPYIIDLESANGTFVNNNKIDPRRYVELIEQDVVKFGYSTREYVLLHENSKGETEDDDVISTSPQPPTEAS